MSLTAERTDKAAPIPSDGDCAHLIAKIGGGEVRALDALYEATVDRLYALAVRIAGDPRDAEEVVADVYHHVWEHHAKFDPSRGSGMVWLSMLTWSRASDRRRKRKPESSLDVLHPDAPSQTYSSGEDSHSGSDVEAFVDGHRVRKALTSLRVEQRRLLLMAFFEGASHSEIADRTGMPLGTVKSHIRRGMDSLRAYLEPGVSYAD